MLIERLKSLMQLTIAVIMCLPINVFTIKEERHSNDFESDNESDHGSINEDEIENILSPPVLPYSPCL